MIQRLGLAGLTLAMCSIQAGCASTRARGPEVYREAGFPNSLWAHELTDEATVLLVTDPRRAETLLLRALTSDPGYGPAHGALGQVYFGRGQFYEAAGELDRARRLMPGHPEPAENLARALEHAAKHLKVRILSPEGPKLNQKAAAATSAVLPRSLRSSRLIDYGRSQPTQERSLDGGKQDQAASAEPPTPIGSTDPAGPGANSSHGRSRLH